MGPRLFSRGNEKLHALSAPPPKASMGPRLFSRGNGSKNIVLTWSILLQWGRGCSAAEMGNRVDDPRCPDPASMGPRLFSRGNDRRRSSHATRS